MYFRRLRHNCPDHLRGAGRRAEFHARLGAELSFLELRPCLRRRRLHVRGGRPLHRGGAHHAAQGDRSGRARETTISHGEERVVE